MKILIADQKSFKSEQEIFLKALQEFCPNETKQTMLHD